MTVFEVPEAAQRFRPARRWQQLAVFFLLACAWSWPFFWWRDMHAASYMAWQIPHPLKSTLMMWGPGLAALFCRWWFRTPADGRIALTGGQGWRAWSFYLVPMLALALVGVESPEFGPEPAHFMVLMLALLGFINVLGEELGWRGHLQPLLQALPRAQRYLLIAGLWALWHFTNLFAGRGGPADIAQYLAWYLPASLALTVLIGEATERGRALTIAVTLHAWADLMMEFAGWRTAAVFLLALPFWGWLLWTWPRTDLTSTSLTAASAHCTN